MAIVYGDGGNNFIDFKPYGNSNDYGYGYGGNDTLLGWDGNDVLYGGAGNDQLYGEAGNDWLYGEAGNDSLSGGTGNDSLNGGAGVDQLWGGSGADGFVFGMNDTGDIFANQADTINDFSAEDKIFLGGGGHSSDSHYAYAGNTYAPGDDQYGIWQHGGNWVVTYNSSGDNVWHDIIVKGGDPHGHIFGLIG